MAWLLIIFQILSAIPTIISVIKTILDLIHTVPNPMQKAAFQSRFDKILADIKAKKALTPEIALALNRLHEELKGCHGN